MINKHNSKENAEKELQEMITYHSNMFCPLIKNLCKTTECMAYFEGVIRLNADDLKYLVYKPCCNSPSINGMIETTYN